MAEKKNARMIELGMNDSGPGPNSVAPYIAQMETLIGRIRNAGALFLGPFAPAALGDYLAGPNHVLPTGGTARFFSGLSAESFRKRTSLIHFDRLTLDRLGQAIIDFATFEGLDAHAKSVTARAQH